MALVWAGRAERAPRTAGVSEEDAEVWTSRAGAEGNHAACVAEGGAGGSGQQSECDAGPESQGR